MISDDMRPNPPPFWRMLNQRERKILKAIPVLLLLWPIFHLMAEQDGFRQMVVDQYGYDGEAKIVSTYENPIVLLRLVNEPEVDAKAVLPTGSEVFTEEEDTSFFQTLREGDTVPIRYAWYSKVSESGHPLHLLMSIEPSHWERLRKRHQREAKIDALIICGLILIVILNLRQRRRVLRTGKRSEATVTSVARENASSRKNKNYVAYFVLPDGRRGWTDPAPSDRLPRQGVIILVYHGAPGTGSRKYWIGDLIPGRR